MDFKTMVAGANGLDGVATDALLVVLVGKPQFSARGAQPGLLGARLSAVLVAAEKSGDFSHKPAQVLYAHRVDGVKAARVAFVACADASVKAWRKAVVAGVSAIKSGGARTLAVAFAADANQAPLDAAHAQALVAAVEESTYVFRTTKPSAPPVGALGTVALLCDKAQAAALTRGLRVGQAVAHGMGLARECANRPANHCTPTFLAEQALALGKEWGLKVQVLERRDCEKLGMGSFLAVAQGSDEAPKFIVAQWLGGAKNEAPVVLVGKGITFDTGGISIKPAAEMDEMKFDMGGAASVLGTLRAVAELKAKVNLIGIIPACENMPSARAVKPGDVVTSMSGQTVEILNTDAEGRLILCDALTYAERFKPAVVVDIATLTGACVIALGHHRSGLFSPDNGLADALLAAGEAAQDPAWRMPLDEEYDEALKSNFADMGNVGGRAGGAITAAMFLKRFTAKLHWAHLDIAGTAWKSGANKGSTGRPVPLLTHFVLSRAR
jgi:leucyl aminopeptidase